MAEQAWLLLKRGLYWRPNDCGYTGIRDHAARYTEAEAKSRARDGSSGVTMVRLEDAPEFSEACYEDLARAHLAQQRAAAADIRRARAALNSQKHGGEPT